MILYLMASPRNQPTLFGQLEDELDGVPVGELKGAVSPREVESCDVVVEENRHFTVLPGPFIKSSMTPSMLRLKFCRHMKMRLGRVSERTYWITTTKFEWQAGYDPLHLNLSESKQYFVIK